MPVRQRKKVFGFKLFPNRDKKSDRAPDFGNANVQCYDPIMKQVAPVSLSPDSTVSYTHLTLPTKRIV